MTFIGMVLTVLYWMAAIITALLIVGVVIALFLSLLNWIFENWL